jgi:hypothetical protein
MEHIVTAFDLELIDGRNGILETRRAPTMILLRVEYPEPLLPLPALALPASRLPPGAAPD